MNVFTKLDECVYKYTDTETVDHPQVTDEMRCDFEKSGFVIVRDVFNNLELKKLESAITNWSSLFDSQFSLKDTTRRSYNVSEWHEPGTDILGCTAGNAKTVGVAEQLLNKGELYMYSGKMIMKPGQTGGTIHWHQDYGYWYNNRAPYPHFITCVIGFTQSDRHNGGLQVIKGSHTCGRIDHIKQAGQTCADLERVHLIQTLMPTLHVDLAAGDCVFFHGNMLHTSGPNNSNDKRWNLIFSYNARINSPDRHHYNACYGEHTLHRHDAHAVARCESTMCHKRDHLNPANNPNVATEP